MCVYMSVCVMNSRTIILMHIYIFICMYICNTHVHMYFICIFEQIQLNFALVDLSLICMREEGSHCGLDSVEDKQIEQHSDKHTHTHTYNTYTHVLI